MNRIDVILFHCVSFSFAEWKIFIEEIQYRYLLKLARYLIKLLNTGSNCKGKVER